MNDEGYIKYQPNWKIKSIDVDEKIMNEINRVRDVMKENGWLGVLPNGVGFGNLSVRTGVSSNFFISGSGTGQLRKLTIDDISLVTDVDIAKNMLSCYGLTQASSESMTHAAFYRYSNNVKAVIHIHDRKLWEKYFNVLPTSLLEAEYGTPEMAFSIDKLLKKQQLRNGIIVMGGHKDGIVIYGGSLDEALKILELHKK